MYVVVTGAAGCLGRAVLPALCADAEIGRVTGIDRVAPAFSNPKFMPVVADIEDAAAREALRGADGLVHLAFVLMRRWLKGRDAARRNVEATRSLLAAAAGAEVRSIVHVSSAAVYGAGIDVTEDAPLDPLPGFRYAQDKARIEAWLARELPHVTILRPTIVLGPNAQPLLREIASMPFYVRIPDPQPRLQCVHEDDVADAIALAVKRHAPGAFNLAAASTFSVRELVRARRPRAFGMPLPLARAALELAWRTTGWGGEPGWLAGVTKTLTIDCRRAHEVLGWHPRHGHWREIAGIPG